MAHVIVAVLIGYFVSAVLAVLLTPSGDPFTMLLYQIPLFIVLEALYWAYIRMSNRRKPGVVSFPFQVLDIKSRNTIAHVIVAVLIGYFVSAVLAMLLARSADPPTIVLYQIPLFIVLEALYWAYTRMSQRKKQSEKR